MVRVTISTEVCTLFDSFARCVSTHECHFCCIEMHLRSQNSVKRGKDVVSGGLDGYRLRSAYC